MKLKLYSKAFSRALGIALTATDDQRVPSKGVIE